jgi:hypothetical protein
MSAEMMAFPHALSGGGMASCKKGGLKVALAK